MPVKQRGKTFQADFSHDGTRYRKAFDTRREAEQWEATMQTRLAAGESLSRDSQGEKPPATLDELLDYTYRRFWSGLRSEDGLYRNGQLVVEILGPDTRLKDIEPWHVDRLVMTLQDKRLANGTINRKLAALSKMLTLATSRGWIRRKIPIERKREGIGRQRYYTPREESRILDTFRHFGLYDTADFVVFLLDTGLRPWREAMGLQWRDCYCDHLIARDRKAFNTTRIPLTKRVRELLDRRQQAGGVGPFTDLGRASVHGHWQRMRTHLQMDSDDAFVPYTCRHTYISRLVQQGVPLKVVQELAGHKTISMTMRYSHLAPTDYSQAVAALESAVSR